MKAAELCAGYGGLALAVEHVFGAETAWVSEFEDAPSKILKYHWPNIPNHGDMTKIDWATVEPVDIISGGTPCQDLSAAGRRRGMTEGTRSNLWVQMREAIAIIKPTYVVWENVRGAYSAGAYSEMEQQEGRVGADGNPHLRALGRVLGDLSDLGYDCQWRGLRAADVGAPHGRYRVFVLGTLRDANSSHVEGQRPRGVEVSHMAPGARERGGAGTSSPNAEMLRRDESGSTPPCQGHQSVGGRDSRKDAADTISEHRGQRRDATPRQATGGRASAVDSGRCGTRPTANAAGHEGREFNGNSDTPAFPTGVGGREGWAEHARVEGRPDALLSGDSPADSSSSAVREYTGEPSTEEAGTGSSDGSRNHRGERPAIDWGPYGSAIRRWEQALGRRAPAPTEPTGRNGSHRLSARFCEWMMGVPNGWICDVPGITRNDALKAAGNGVVPQQAIAALQDMLRNV